MRVIIPTLKFLMSATEMPKHAAHFSPSIFMHLFLCISISKNKTHIRKLCQKIASANPPLTYPLHFETHALPDFSPFVLAENLIVPGLGCRFYLGPLFTSSYIVLKWAAPRTLRLHLLHARSPCLIRKTKLNSVILGCYPANYIGMG